MTEVNQDSWKKQRKHTVSTVKNNFFWNLCTDQVLPEPSQTLIILAYALVVTVAGIKQ
jgi:hypothetical protein